MCLQLFAVPAIEGRVSPDRLSRVSGLRIAKRNQPLKGALHFSRDGGCSCSMMADNADWNAPEWALEPETLEGLASALQVLDNEAGGIQPSGAQCDRQTRSRASGDIIGGMV